VAVLAVNLVVIFRLLFPGENPLVFDSVSAVGLAAIEISMVVGVWYVSLRTSHKIVGPLYVISREVAKLGRGDFSANIVLRRKDMFQELAAEMNSSFAQLRQKMESLNDIARQLETSDGQGENVQGLLKKLQKEISNLNNGGLES
jgi:methyl-accepting chemotaxis protein